MPIKRPPLSIKQILGWADAHHKRTGKWPGLTSGPVVGAREAQVATWLVIDYALRSGLRGLPGGSSVAKLLAKRRGRRRPLLRPPLSIKQILAWADAHRKRTGEWPTQVSGPVREAPGTTWLATNTALRSGGRGLRGGSSLHRLLVKYRGKRITRKSSIIFTIEEILAWAKAHHERTGKWPYTYSGPFPEAPDPTITWRSIDSALKYGFRGLPGRSSLARLLDKHFPRQRPRRRPTRR